MPGAIMPGAIMPGAHPIDDGGIMPGAIMPGGCIMPGIDGGGIMPGGAAAAAHAPEASCGCGGYIPCMPGIMPGQYIMQLETNERPGKTKFATSAATTYSRTHSFRKDVRDAHTCARLCPHTRTHAHTHIHAYIMDRPSNASDLSINSQQHLSTIIPSIKDHPNNILAQGCSAHARIFLKLLPSHPCSEHSQIPLHIE